MGGLRLKKAVAISSIAFYLHYADDMRRLALFGIFAAIVPPPAGILSGLLAVGFYEAAQCANRVGRKMMGYAQSEDFEILGQVNERYHRARRSIVPFSYNMEKTVFRRPEMR